MIFPKDRYLTAIYRLTALYLSSKSSGDDSQCVTGYVRMYANSVSSQAQDTLQIQRAMVVQVLPQLQLWDEESPFSPVKKGVSSTVVLEALLPLYLWLTVFLGRDGCSWDRAFAVLSPALFP